MALEQAINLSFCQRVMLEQRNGTVLCCAENNKGQPFYLIIDASKNQIEAMYRDWQAEKKVDFAAYGKILYRDWGSEPPPALWQWISQPAN